MKVKTRNKKKKKQLMKFLILLPKYKILLFEKDPNMRSNWPL